MMEITTSSSISVKPGRVLVFAARNMAVPLNLGARALTLPVLCLVLLPERSVPDLDLSVALVAAAGGQAPAVRAERHPEDVARVAPEGHPGRGVLPPRQVPHAHGLVPPARGEPAAVRVEGQAISPLGVPLELAGHLPGGGVPDQDAPSGDGGQGLAIGAEGHAPDAGDHTGKRDPFLAGGQRPDPGRMIAPARRGKKFAV